MDNAAFDNVADRLAFEAFMAKMFPDGIGEAGPHTTDEPQPDAPPGDGTEEELFRTCGDGERTSQLTKIAGRLVRTGLPLARVVDIAQLWNRSNRPPLSEAKVAATCASIFRTHRRNHSDDQADPEDPLRPLFALDEVRIDKLLETEPPKRRYLLKDFLPLGKVGGIVAPGGTGKSQLLLQLAVSIATSLDLADHWAVDEPGAVLCIFAEDDIEEIHRRLRNLIAALPASSSVSQQLLGLRERLFIRSAVGEDNLMTAAPPSKGDVKRTTYVDRLVLAAEPIPKLNLIIVDPASRFRGGDENSAQDMTRFIEELERLSKLTGATVLVAHHANKASMQAGEQTQAAARGSSAFTDGIRWQVNLHTLTKPDAKDLGIAEDERHNFLSVTLTKSNYGPPQPVVYLRRDEGGLLVKHAFTRGKAASEDALLAEVRRLLEAEKAHGNTYSRTSFEKAFGGEAGPLEIGQERLRKLLKKWVDNGELGEGKGRILLAKTDGSMHRDGVGHRPKSTKKSKN